MSTPIKWCQYCILLNLLSFEHQSVYTQNFMVNNYKYVEKEKKLHCEVNEAAIISQLVLEKWLYKNKSYRQNERSGTLSNHFQIKIYKYMLNCMHLKCCKTHRKQWMPTRDCLFVSSYTFSLSSFLLHVVLSANLMPSNTYFNYKLMLGNMENRHSWKMNNTNGGCVIYGSSGRSHPSLWSCVA